MRRSLIFILTLLGLTACSMTATATNDPLATGRRAYTTYCAACHSVSDVGNDTFGPNLSALYARAQTEPDPGAWLREAIIYPNTELAPGYQAGIMPMSYATDLSAEKLDGLVIYMLEVGAPQP